MKRALFLAACAALALLPAPAAEAQRRAAARPAPRPAAQVDWTRVAARTPEGGFRLGNPNARIKLVEYLSLTCPHCAAFAHESGPVLIPLYVRSGRVSLEYRNYYLNGLDVAAALLSRCATPASYFAITHNLLATQATWTARIQAVPPERRQQLQAMEPLALTQQLIAIMGLDAVGQRYGIGPATRRACLTQANLTRLEQLHDAGEQAGVAGTPAFFINGARVEVNSWAGIEPLLRGR